MDIKRKMMELATEARTLAAKANDNPGAFTDADSTRAAEVIAEHSQLSKALDQQASLNAAIAGIDGGKDRGPDDTNSAEYAKKSLGQRFIGSEGYQNFRKAHPNGLSPQTPVDIRADVSKALNTTDLGLGGAKPAFTDDLVYRRPLTLLDLITTGTTAESFLPYRQVITKTNEAAIVKEGELKPISTLTTRNADAKAHTYADGMEVTNQELSDDGAIQALIDSTLTWNVRAEIERVLLSGAGTADEPAGLLNTTGVQAQAFATDMVTTLRKAKTKLVENGTRIQGVLLNPEDDEAWDLLKDNTGRFLGAGPFGAGPSTAWAIPRIATAAVPVGQAIMGDFSTIHFLVREALKIQAFNQHKDFAQRNLNYIRAELRALQMFRAPGRLVVATIAGA